MALRPAHERYISSSLSLEHCPSVYNVFHPYDPLATRCERDVPLLLQWFISCTSAAHARLLTIPSLQARVYGRWQLR